MKGGDLVRHTHSTIHGRGIIVEMPVKSGPYSGDASRCMIMWHCQGKVVCHSLDLSFVEVINEAS